MSDEQNEMSIEEIEDRIEHLEGYLFLWDYEVDELGELLAMWVRLKGQGDTEAGT